MSPSPQQQRIAHVLGRNSWFASRPKEMQDSLVQHAQVSTVSAGEWLYDTGDEAHGLYGVLSGSVMTHVVLANGDSVPISLSGPGTIFGYAAQILRGKRITTAIARERSEVIYVPQRAIAAIVHNMPSLWLHFAELATDQLNWAARAYAECMRLPPLPRIASRLYLLSFPWGAEEPIAVPLRQDELADLMGLSRKTVNRVLQELEARGLVETGYGTIFIRNPEGLREVSAEDPETV